MDSTCAPMPLLADAQRSIVEKRVDDLYSQVQQVSELLQGIIKAFIRTTEDQAAQNPATVALPEAESFQTDVPPETPLANTDKEPEPLRAMAMAA